MVDQLYQRCSACLGAAATSRGRGAESGVKETDDHEGCQACHLYATARGGRSAEIYGERIVGHDINADREGFASRSACTFLAPFSSVFHTPELGSRLKSNNLGNEKVSFLLESFAPSTSGI